MKKEVDLAENLIAHLIINGYEVYQEVPDSWGSGAIDIVARKDEMNHAIECKLNFNLDVLAQADSNRNFAEFTSICVPFTKRTRSKEFALRVAKQLGIGVFEVSRFNSEVTISVNPIFNTSIVRPLVLFERQKTYAKAGSNGGKAWSEFQQTKEDVIKYVTDNGSTHLKVIMSNIKHHYANERSAIATFASRIRQGIVSELMVEANIVSIKPSQEIKSTENNEG